MGLSTLKVVSEGKVVKICTYSNTSRVYLKANKANKKAIYVGSKDVTADTGFPIDPGEVFNPPSMDYNALYCVSGEKGDTLHLIVWSK